MAVVPAEQFNKWMRLLYVCVCVCRCVCLFEVYHSNIWLIARVMPKTTPTATPPSNARWQPAASFQLKMRENKWGEKKLLLHCRRPKGGNNFVCVGEWVARAVCPLGFYDVATEINVNPCYPSFYLATACSFTMQRCLCLHSNSSSSSISISICCFCSATHFVFRLSLLAVAVSFQPFATSASTTFLWFCVFVSLRFTVSFVFL